MVAKTEPQLVTDQDYLPKLLELISKARKSIDIVEYSFAIGSASGRISFEGAPYKIASALKKIRERKGENFRIRLYIEGFRETEERNRITAEYLRDAGIEIMYGSTHAKGFCIDEKYVFFGSTNLTNQSLTKNFEANLLFSDRKIAAEFTRYFEFLWKGGQHGEIRLKPPFLADGAFKDALVGMCDRAKKRVEFSIYFFDHSEIAEAISRAHERGVKVTGFVHHHKSFAFSYVRRNYRTVKFLKERGVEDIWLSIPTTFSHSKYIVVDREEIALGTGNWLVEDVEIHPQLYVQLRDQKLAQKLVRHLQRQITAAIRLTGSQDQIQGSRFFRA